MSSHGRLDRKVAIVTGSSSGLGRAIALLYAREGARVVCADLQPTARSAIRDEGNANTDDLIRKDGGEAIFVKIDVSSGQEMETLVKKAVEKFCRLDV